MKGKAVFKSIFIAAVLGLQGLTVWQGANAQPMSWRVRMAPDVVVPGMAQPLDSRMAPGFAPTLVQGEARIPPSQAAMAAQAAYPGSTVLNVKLLPSGEYAVTLKIGGSVQRVMVNATNGQVS